MTRWTPWAKTTKTTGPAGWQMLRRTMWVGVPLILIPTLLQRRVIAKRLARVSSTRPPHSESTAAMTARVQSVVEDIRARLEIPDPIIVLLVAHNDLVVSVERNKDRREEFLLQLEQDFIVALPEDELRAVVAHELGHVWISTHHPFLQTEELANEVALRVASRQSLETVYDKVWKRTGTKGALAYLPVQ